MTPETTSRTIVVGYDGSPSARAAVEHAIDRTGPAGRIVLVHAYQVPAGYVGASYYSGMVEDAAQHAADVMAGLEEALTSATSALGPPHRRSSGPLTSTGPTRSSSAAAAWAASAPCSGASPTTFCTARRAPSP